MSSNRQSATHPVADHSRDMALQQTLTQRLNQLVSGLAVADLPEKSMDAVKEIKELHTILRTLDEAEHASNPRQIVVVWKEDAAQ